MALLLVPLVSLIALWAFAAMISVGGVVRLMDVAHVTDRVGYPVEDAVEALSTERKDAMVFLADPHDAGALADLRAAGQHTDNAIAVVRTNSRSQHIPQQLDPDSRRRLDALLAQASQLQGLRSQVASGKLSPSAAYASYNGFVDPYFTFFLGLNPLQNVQLDRQSRVLTQLSMAREAVSREDSLYSAALVAGRMTRADQRAFSDAVSEQRLIYATYPQLLTAADAALFDDYWRSSTGQALHDDEERVLDAQPSDATRQVTAADWRTTASSVLSDLSSLDRQAGDDYKQRVHPYAVGVLVRAGVAGGFGLLAVVISVVVSFRVGRGLARDLSALRKEAQEASGTRLPRVMRRLAAGEDVDIETEVPRLEFPDDEMGAVGKALNTLQRAAVEAAVRQADMRRGVSDVFVNLARRNQVLLHRQLTLLDAMERRTEAGEELADLFKLDHMTTRMRRHAEGLVILSGAAPSRQWRKPVPLMDVVRAAVAEVEDYERIEVRRLPRLAVAGPAVGDLTHLLAELVENATVFSPPHTTVQVHGQHVANGYVLEIDDRGLGMTPEALLDANLRLAETPEFELSDTDRLGLFVVSRLAQRQGVRVSLRPSPYGGTTAVVLVPTALLTEAGDDAATGEQALPDGAEHTARQARPALGVGDADGVPDEIVLPVRTARVEAAGASREAFREWGMLPGSPGDTDALGDDDAHARDDTGAARLPRRRPPRTARRFDRPDADGAGTASHPGNRTGDHPDSADAGLAEQHQQAEDATVPAPRGERHDDGRPAARPAPDDAPLPRRRRRVPAQAARPRADADRPATDSGAGAPVGGGLPKRVRQASLAPQLRADDTTQTRQPAPQEPAGADRDADELRSRMASLQRGWQRGRAEADEDAPGPGPSSTTGTTGTTPDRADAPGDPGGDATGTTSEGDGR
ncbi:nitrate- and nitrite sensing domain-containing protein [Streptantibioticus parmotrematis]|uniref:nitrate- and nitrite sensing domain-containing protein n=1 Tax=Streptantibioticus parmotrematis TaxID=2873249 RepID=UPI0027DEBF17|nr:nitrate- and nitrite sensing domain-containing protein [Streptantibioticus parmotrematis]